MDRFKLLHYLLLLLLASAVAARRHHSGGPESDGGGDKSGGSGPAWEARRNDWTKGTDLLDWSRDPRRVDPKVYTMNSMNCEISFGHWPYTMTGQLEGQEWPAGLVKGDQVEPKSKAQLVICEGFRWPFQFLTRFPRVLWFPNQDFPLPKTKQYLANNDIMLERESPMERCSPDDKCPKRDENCTTYRIYNPSEAEYINGSISGNLSGRIEQLLRDYGPMGVFYDNRPPLQLDESGFWNLSRQCDMDPPLPIPYPIGPGYRTSIGDKSWPQANFLLVGYGRTDDGVGYFKFKTSLGPKWGDGGFGYFKHTSDERRCADLHGEIELWKIKPCGSGSPERHSRARSRHHKMHSHRVKPH